MAPGLLNHLTDLPEGLKQHHLVRSDHGPATGEVHGQQDEGEEVLYEDQGEFAPVVRRALQGCVGNILLVRRTELDLLQALFDFGHVAMLGLVIRCRDLIVQRLLIH